MRHCRPVEAKQGRCPSDGWLSESRSRSCRRHWRATQRARSRRSRGLPDRRGARGRPHIADSQAQEAAAPAEAEDARPAADAAAAEVTAATAATSATPVAGNAAAAAAAMAAAVAPYMAATAGDADFAAAKQQRAVCAQLPSVHAGRGQACGLERQPQSAQLQSAQPQSAQPQSAQPQSAHQRPASMEVQPTAKPTEGEPRRCTFTLTQPTGSCPRKPKPQSQATPLQSHSASQPHSGPPQPQPAGTHRARGSPLAQPQQGGRPGQGRQGR